MLFWKKFFSAKEAADVSAESRTGQNKRRKFRIPKPDENNNFLDSEREKKAVKRIRGKHERINMRWSKKRIILVTCLAVFISVLAGAFLFVYDIWANPMDQFDTVAKQIPEHTESETPIASKTWISTVAPSATATPTKDPYESLVSEADFSILKNIVNIMLIGVDFAPERQTWKGKHAYHSDVMIVLSINTVTNEVNLISLPRDTYAKIPGVRGIYKLNASIDCGGGWPKDKGFKKVCEAASWMLGGIPVQYYYAVDMSAVKGLVDSVGGVDFNLDFAFKMQNRSYKTGMQHMDGQAVLDYLRVRKKIGSESGDLNRINRQKKMLVAIFEKIKSSGLLANLPKMLDSFEGGLHTNTTLEQTAGLAAFLYKIDSSKIKLHSMGGDYHSIFNWSFVITDQQKRVKLIKDIYGISVPIYKEYTYGSALHLWENMQKKVIASKSKSILRKVKKLLNAAKPKPAEPSTSPSDEPSTSPTESAITSTSLKSAERPAETGMKAERLEQGNVALNTGIILLKPGITPDKYEYALKLYNEAMSTYKRLLKSGSTSGLHSMNAEMKSDIERLCSMFSISKPSWRVNYERNSNKVYVDFR